MRTPLATHAPDGVLGNPPVASLVHRAADAVRGEALAVGQRTEHYVHEAPMTSLLIAAVFGAALTAIAALTMWRGR